MSRINPPKEIPKASAEAHALFQKELMDKVKRKLDRGHAKTEFSDRLEAAAMAAAAEEVARAETAALNPSKDHKHKKDKKDDKHKRDNKRDKDKRKHKKDKGKDKKHPKSKSKKHKHDSSSSNSSSDDSSPRKRKRGDSSDTSSDSSGARKHKKKHR